MKETSIFKALADPTRRQILVDLATSEMGAGEIAARFSISNPSISRHLAVLKNAELVSERREGNRIIYRLQPNNMAVCMSKFLGVVCPDQLLVKYKAGKRSRRGASHEHARD